MWEFEASLVTAAPVERLWELWTDVAAWADWHPGIAQAELDGAFGEGAEGRSRAPGGPLSKLRIGRVDTGARFVSETEMPLAHLDFEHRLDPVGDGATRLVYRVRMTGIATPVFSRVLGPRFRRRMPEALEALAAAASGS